MKKSIALLFISALVFNSCENQFVASESAEVQKKSEIEINKSMATPDEPIYIVDGVTIPLAEAKEIIATKIKSIQVQKRDGKAGVVKIELKNEDKHAESAFKVILNSSYKPVYIIDGVKISKKDFEDIDQNRISAMRLTYDESSKTKTMELELKQDL